MGNASSRDRIIEILQSTVEALNPWMTPHIDRYAATFTWAKRYTGDLGVALEIGSTLLFQKLLTEDIGFTRYYGTRLGSCVEVVGDFLILNLEHNELPLPDNSVDFVLCCEVIEHMDVDPMFMLSELNRAMKHGGQLLLTTPNSTSSHNTWKILNGYAPHFFMQYTKDRNPYRHNIEYDVHGLSVLMAAAGFEMITMETIDKFAPQQTAAMAALKTLGFSTDHRGDNIFYLGRKASGVINRWPDRIYI